MLQDFAAWLAILMSVGLIIYVGCQAYVCFLDFQKYRKITHRRAINEKRSYKV